MALKTLFQKTGAAGTVGLNTNAMPASVPVPASLDARGLTVFVGLEPEQPYLISYTKDTVDGKFTFEMSLDGSLFVPLGFTRLDTGAVIDGTVGLTLGATGLVPVKPLAQWNVPAIRVVGWVAAAGGAGDILLISSFLRGM